MDDVIEKLLKDLREKAAEVKKIYATLQTLQSYDDRIVIPQLAILLGDENLPSAEGGRVTIRPDEFYNMSNTEAAEKYLRKLGHSATLDEIFNKLKEGGAYLTSANAKNNLNIQLTRATRKFAKISTGTSVSFGLLDWYPKRAKKAGSNQGSTNTEDSESEEPTEEANTDEKSE
jgi:hypothetical protein